jgi:hypothetical protein
MLALHLMECSSIANVTVARTTSSDDATEAHARVTSYCFELFHMHWFAATR